jgi:DNA repair exonuclease SbcCD ATPase subunit
MSKAHISQNNNINYSNNTSNNNNNSTKTPPSAVPTTKQQQKKPNLARPGSTTAISNNSAESSASRLAPAISPSHANSGAANLSSGNSSTASGSSPSDDLIQMLQDKIVNLQQEIAEVREENKLVQSLQNRISSYEMKVEEQGINISELRDQLIRAQEAANHDLTLFNLEVEKEIARSKQEKERVKLQNDLNKQEQFARTAKKQIENLTAEINKMRAAGGLASLSPTSLGDDSALKTEISQLKTDQNALKQENKQLHFELQQEKQQISKLLQQNKTLEQEKIKLESAAASGTVRETSVLDGKLKDLQQKVEEKDKELRELHELLNKIKNNGETSENSSKTVILQRESATLSEKLQKKAAEAEKLTTEVTSLRKELTEQVEAHNSAVKSFGIQLESSQKQRADAEKQLNERLSSVQSDLQRRNDEFSAFQQQSVTEIATRQQKINSLNVKLQEERVEATKRYSELQAESAARITSLQNELDGVRLDFVHLQSAFSEYQAAAEKKQKELESEIERVSGDKIEVQTDAQKKRVTIRALQEQLAQLRTENNDLQQTVAKQQNQMSTGAVGFINKLAGKNTTTNNKTNKPTASPPFNINTNNQPRAAAADVNASSPTEVLTEDVSFYLTQRVQELESDRLAHVQEINELKYKLQDIQSQLQQALQSNNNLSLGSNASNISINTSAAMTTPNSNPKKKK